MSLLRVHVKSRGHEVWNVESGALKKQRACGEETWRHWIVGAHPSHKTRRMGHPQDLRFDCATKEPESDPPPSYSGQGEGRALQRQGIALAEELTGFGRGNTRVGGEAIEVVEARARGPRGEHRFAELSEALLEAVERDAGEGIARGDGAARAGIAALEMDFADLEAHGAALVFTEELVLPEGGHAVNFKRGAEAQADFVQGEPREPFAYSLERSRRNDRGSVGDGVVGKTPGGIAHQDLLLEIHAEPFGRVIVSFGEREGVHWNSAAVARNGKRDAAQIRSESGADQVNCGSALAIDPAAIHGIERPGAVERQAAGRTDARFASSDGVECFDGMEAQIREARG